MPMKFSPAFPTWRIAWEEDETLHKKLSRIDELRKLRARGNFILPSIPKGYDRKAIRQCYDEVYRVFAAPDGRIFETIDRQILDVMTLIAPFLPAIRWGRWLYLEKALEQSMLSGDLLFAAVILRSLAEELLRLRALEIGSNTLPEISASTIKAWAASILIGIEPLVQDHSAAKNKEAEYFDLLALEPIDESILKCMKALNDYIHPNYGSHILALYPESAEGSIVIVEAVEQILTAFLQLNWANDLVLISGHSMDPPYISDFSKLAWHLKTRLMPSIKAHAKTRYGVKDYDPVPLTTWLSSDDSVYLAALNSAEIAQVLAPLRKTTTKSPGPDDATDFISHILGDRGPWRLKGPELFFRLANTRRVEQALCKDFPNGPPSNQSSSEWFIFVTRSFELMILMTSLKIEFFKIQMVRQIIDQNLVGITSCMRSLLEHFAVSHWILERLNDRWVQIKNKTQSTGTIHPETADRFQDEVARFLSGTRGTVENMTSWARQKPGINVSSAVESAFKSYAMLQSEYDFSSAALHGRLMRGVELCVPNKDYIDNILMRAVRCLNLFCDREFTHGYLIQSMRIWANLNNVARVLNGTDDLNRHELAQAFGAVSKLKLGRDYTGTGSSERDPITFCGPLSYHLAFHQYCKQENLDPATRRIEFKDGIIFDVLRQLNNEIWFRAPGLGLSPS